ncbi:rhodanese-like domain-containing protein [Texcoconibacillus texcoconensis]|uniref:Rhodanese-related sulfurtransferase n=1 Tax=Texcoconibacillus texcoconensis TaxID=1095777 RepID=A0A840QNZ5_9BACI|nr:rhodanese-like domain-containing protein [Texcoconibacillus texcoconensis]MBB5173095.1 rhodanese-related sulfurtransferase [Texcoconibacillus texcoconensis]
MAWLYVILTIILIIFIISRLKKPSDVKSVTTEEFKEGYRKAQLFDIREEKEFNTGHILGARNLPLSQMRHRLTEVRPDQAVYLYDQNGSRIAQASKLLKKKRGVEEIVALKGGFKKWTGKIKK